MNENYPLLKDRIQSTFIDFIFLIVLLGIGSAIMDKFENVPDWVPMTLFIGLFIVYEPLFTTLGCTMGNKIKGIRVRKHSDTNRKINFVDALIRYAIKCMLGWLSFVTIGSNPKRRAIHDLVVGSVMVKV
ncbi:MULTISPECIES: RDD family protein [Niastella]|uniref:RDD family protein n=1 Tax=Niastella soli TaxID=2821487 RepID=A0ABS3Z3I0_9BACT|nr:RDD family protein [Niastella soli]MBO9203951.1 RDD family protein [Niastella soli]